MNLVTTGCYGGALSSEVDGYVQSPTPRTVCKRYGNKELKHSRALLEFELILPSLFTLDLILLEVRFRHQTVGCVVILRSSSRVVATGY